MEFEVLYRMSMLMGFLLAGFLALLIGVLIFALHSWAKASIRELERLIDDLETTEEGSGHEE